MPHENLNLLTAFPSSVVNREHILERFGAEGLRLLLDLATAGDSLADAAILSLRDSTEEQRSSLESGILHGLKTLTAPPLSVKQLLEQVESVPDWTDESSLLRGSEAYLTIGALWMTVSLGPGSLAHTYSSPNIAKVLMKTGNLDTSAPRRLAETGTWEQQTLRPGGLVAGAEGYIHTLQVRLLHARVRAGMLRKGWSTDEQGVPISQLDLVRTWLDFTYVPFSALEKIGITFSDQEFLDLYHLWQRVAHLLGVEPRFYRQVTDQASAARLLALIDASCPSPDENSRQLTDKMLTAVGQLLQPALGVPEQVAINLMHSFCRLFHSAEFCQAMGVKPNWTESLLPALADANRYQRHLERSDKSIRRGKMAETLLQFDQAIAALEGQTAYQNNLESLGSADLSPKT